MNADDTDSQLMNYLVRMVVPMRREFGRQLNVRQFLDDGAYAREVLDEALGSKDARLLEYARYVETRLHGPRVADLAPVPAASAPQPASGDAAAKLTTAPPTPTAPQTAEEMRAQILKKYTDGLR